MLKRLHKLPSSLGHKIFFVKATAALEEYEKYVAAGKLIATNTTEKTPTNDKKRKNCGSSKEESKAKKSKNERMCSICCSDEFQAYLVRTNPDTIKTTCDLYSLRLIVLLDANGHFILGVLGKRIFLLPHIKHFIKCKCVSVWKKY